MKKCSWCGSEYPDHETICSIDHHPLIHMIEQSVEPRASCFSPSKNDVLALLLIFGAYLALNYFLWRPGEHFPNQLPETATAFLLLLTWFVFPLLGYFVITLRTLRKCRSNVKRWGYATLLSFGLTLCSALVFFAWMVIMFFQIPP